jgi:hypothetical protein
MCDRDRVNKLGGSNANAPTRPQDGRDRVPQPNARVLRQGVLPTSGAQPDVGKIFNVPAPSGPMAFVDTETFTKLKEISNDQG